MHRKRDILPLRIIKYLQTRPDLHLSLESFDAANESDMKYIMESLSPTPCGCLLLTASPSDGMFRSLSEEDFQRARHAASGVFHALRATLDVSQLDFLIFFSSVSAVFGNGGQTNYSS